MERLDLARKILHKLAQDKSASIALPVAAGAAVVGGAHVLGKGMQKSREYKAGFQPGAYAGSHV